MTTKKYLVVGPGRTGSTFLIKYLTKLANVLSSNDQEKIEVWQTHDPKLQLDHNNVIIMSRRKDLWAAIISSILANHYGEWVNYTNQPGTFVADLDDFENRYVWQCRWHEAFEYYTSYNHRINIYFEDFVSNPLHINEKLNLPLISIPAQTQPSPYKEDRIENLEELKSRFLYLENDWETHNFPIHMREWDWNGLRLLGPN